MNLKGQRRMAAQLMKVGKNKVKFDSDRLDDASEALTKDDVRALINSGAITERPKVGNSRGRVRQRKAQQKKGRQRGSAAGALIAH